MKFFILVGESSTDGTVMYGDRIYGDRDFTSNAPTDKWEHIWAVRYDSVNNVNCIEWKTTKPEGREASTEMSNELRDYYNVWARTECDKIEAEIAAATQAQQDKEDTEYLSEWDNWGTIAERKQARSMRDDLLEVTDHHEYITSLKNNEWDTFRQWVRDLPATFASPLDITFESLPSGYNTNVFGSYESFKSAVQKGKDIKARLSG
jgi:hypothetical protein|tara:strand:+ start:7480 stop:8097 length:618 start_codon:yes stop_codon:yes gene_type:complete